MSKNKVLNKPKPGNMDDVLKRELTNVFPHIKTIVPKHMTPERLARMALTTISRNPKLAQCTTSSLIGSILNCAILGLEPTILGHIYLVPFYNKKLKCFECQFVIGYKGYIELVRRTGQCSQIYARPVYENDLFVYVYGQENTLIHVPFDMLTYCDGYTPVTNGISAAIVSGAIKHLKERQATKQGEISKYYACYKLIDGSFGFHVMTREQTRAHALEYSKSQQDGRLVGPWADHFDAMSLKTCIRKLIKYMPLTLELQEQMSADEAILGPSFDSEDNLSIDAAPVEAYDEKNNYGLEIPRASVECDMEEGPFE